LTKRNSIKLMFSIFFCVMFFVAAGRGQIDQDNSSIQAANDAVNQAFIAVLDAEQAGANVTSLLSQLNGAAKLLANAENAMRAGNADNAANNADTAVSIARQVTSQAQRNKESALASKQDALVINIAWTITASVILVIILILLWWWTKKRYVNTLMKAKPEVVSNET
jgi:hypothetical protein